MKKQKELVTYFFVALAGVCVQLIVSSLAQRQFQFSYQNSVALGYAISVITGFFLTKIFAFKNATGHTKRQILKYLGITTISGFLTTFGALYTKMLINAVLNSTVYIDLFSYHIDVIEFFSHLAGMGFSFIFNFTGHKYFTFRSTGFYTKLNDIFAK